MLIKDLVAKVIFLEMEKWWNTLQKPNKFEMKAKLQKVSLIYNIFLKKGSSPKTLEEDHKSHGCPSLPLSFPHDMFYFC